MEDIKLKIGKFCAEKGIGFAYLFGSFVQKRQNLRSDIDMAIYLDKAEEGCLLDIYASLSKILKQDKIDIVILNRASIFMQFKIIQKGRLLYCKDVLKRIRYEAKVMSLYYDRQYYYNRHIRDNLESISRRGIL